MPIPQGHFVSILAINHAIERCTTAEGLKEIDEKSLALLNTSSYGDRARVYEYMHNRWNLILDAMGEGAYAEKRRQLLNSFK